MSDTARPKSSGDKLTADEINRELPIQMTAGEAIASTPIAVYIKASDGYAYKTDASFVDERIQAFIGFTSEVAGGSGSAIAVQVKGIVTGFTGLIAGSRYYLSDTAGAVGTPVGTYGKCIGRAVSATEIRIEIDEWSNLGTASGDFTAEDTPSGNVAIPTGTRFIVCTLNVYNVDGGTTTNYMRGQVLLVPPYLTSGLISSGQGTTTSRRTVTASISGTNVALSTDVVGGTSSTTHLVHTLNFFG